MCMNEQAHMGLVVNRVCKYKRDIKVTLKKEILIFNNKHPLRLKHTSRFGSLAVLFNAC